MVQRYKRLRFYRTWRGRNDIFVHISAVRSAGMGDLEEGQEVEFDVVENDGKTSAENLK